MSNPSCICPAVTSNISFNEEETLEAMAKFRKFYEEKIIEIDLVGGGDCKELKIKLQERWIKDLTEQTEMMATIVKELEEEATTRVKMLEEKLKQTSKAAYEVMKRYQTYNITHNLDEPFQKVYYMENDLKNLLEFIRRIRDDRNWCIDGLQFYDVTYSDLFGWEQNYDSHAKDTVLVPITNGSEPKKVGKSLKMTLQVVNDLHKEKRSHRRSCKCCKCCSPSRECRAYCRTQSPVCRCCKP